MEYEEYENEKGCLRKCQESGRTTEDKNIDQ